MAPPIGFSPWHCWQLSATTEATSQGMPATAGASASGSSVALSGPAIGIGALAPAPPGGNWPGWATISPGFTTTLPVSSELGADSLSQPAATRSNAHAAAVNLTQPIMFGPPEPHPCGS